MNNPVNDNDLPRGRMGSIGMERGGKHTSLLSSLEVGKRQGKSRHGFQALKNDGFRVVRNK